MSKDRLPLMRLVWRLHHGTTLTLKIYIPAVVYAAAVFAVIAVVFYQAMGREITRQYEERARGVPVFLDHEIATDPAGDPIGTAAAHIDVVMDAYPDVYRLTIYARVDDAYRAVASSDPAQIGRKADPHDEQPFRTGAAYTEEHTIDGRRVLEVSHPISQRGRPVAVVGIYMSLAERDLRLAALLRWIVLTATLTFAGIVGLSYAIARFAILVPMRRLLDASEAVAAGNLSVDVPLGWGEVPPTGVRFEITRFSQAFRTMVHRLRLDREALHDLSITDPLTGLHNRRYFEEVIHRELAQAHRSLQPFAIVMIDIDGLRQVNNRFGHLAGDRLLQRTADFLRRNARASDEIVRWGGDEFLILMPRTNAAQAAQAVRRFRSALAGGHARGDERLSLSIGVSTWEPGKDLASMLREADTDMYRQKSRLP